MQTIITTIGVFFSRYDIAVLKLNEYVNFTEGVNEIRLPTTNETAAEFCYAVGFGMTDYSKKRAPFLYIICLQMNECHKR